MSKTLLLFVLIVSLATGCKKELSKDKVDAWKIDYAWIEVDTAFKVGSQVLRFQAKQPGSVVQVVYDRVPTQSITHTISKTKADSRNVRIIVQHDPTIYLPNDTNVVVTTTVQNGYMIVTVPEIRVYQQQSPFPSLFKANLYLRLD